MKSAQGMDAFFSDKSNLLHLSQAGKEVEPNHVPGSFFV
jgi:hypothetical protein